MKKLLVLLVILAAMVFGSSYFCGQYIESFYHTKLNEQKLPLSDSLFLSPELVSYERGILSSKAVWKINILYPNLSAPETIQTTELNISETICHAPLIPNFGFDATDWFALSHSVGMINSESLSYKALVSYGGTFKGELVVDEYTWDFTENGYPIAISLEGASATVSVEKNGTSSFDSTTDKAQVEVKDKTMAVLHNVQSSTRYSHRFPIPLIDRMELSLDSVLIDMSQGSFQNTVIIEPLSAEFFISPTDLNPWKKSSSKSGERALFSYRFDIGTISQNGNEKISRFLFGSNLNSNQKSLFELIQAIVKKRDFPKTSSGVVLKAVDQWLATGLELEVDTLSVDSAMGGVDVVFSGTCHPFTSPLFPDDEDKGIQLISDHIQKNSECHWEIMLDETLVGLAALIGGNPAQLQEEGLLIEEKEQYRVVIDYNRGKWLVNERSLDSYKTLQGLSG